MDADRPIYAQILERIEKQIISGEYAPGAKVPSVRELAAEAGVNPNTMQRALAELERKKLVIGYRTSGRVVTENEEMIVKRRRQMAEEMMRDFLQKMKELGFDREEVLSLLKREEGEYE